MDNQPNEKYGQQQKTDVNAPKSNRNEQSDVNSTNEMNTANRSSTSQDATQSRSNPGSSQQDSKKNY